METPITPPKLTFLPASDICLHPPSLGHIRADLAKLLSRILIHRDLPHVCTEENDSLKARGGRSARATLHTAHNGRGVHAVLVDVEEIFLVAPTGPGSTFFSGVIRRLNTYNSSCLTAGPRLYLFRGSGRGIMILLPSSK